MEACAGKCSRGWPSHVDQPTTSSTGRHLSAGGLGPSSHLVRRDLPNAPQKTSENKDRHVRRKPTASARQSQAQREKKKQRIAVRPATMLSLQEQVPPQSCTHGIPCSRHMSTVFLSVTCHNVVRHQQPSVNKVPNKPVDEQRRNRQRLMHRMPPVTQRAGNLGPQQ